MRNLIKACSYISGLKELRGPQILEAHPRSPSSALSHMRKWMGILCGQSLSETRICSHPKAPVWKAPRV